MDPFADRNICIGGDYFPVSPFKTSLSMSIQEPRGDGEPKESKYRGGMLYNCERMGDEQRHRTRLDCSHHLTESVVFNSELGFHCVS